MANPDPSQNGISTRFAQGDGRKRGGTSETYSLRAWVRYIANTNVDPLDEKALEKLFGPEPKPTQRGALKVYIKMLAGEGDMKAIEFIDERIDGKLPQTNINAAYEEIAAMSGEELEQFISQRSGSPAPSNGATRAGETPGSGIAEAGSIQPIPE